MSLIVLRTRYDVRVRPVFVLVMLALCARLGMGGTAFAVDYSYVAFENFDAVHMFSFDFKF